LPAGEASGVWFLPLVESVTVAGKTPVLILIQGDEPGTRWKLQENRVTTIGRSSRNEISLVHPSVSRYHCEISYINGLWYMADLNSKKGTVLNGTEVTDREVLKPGDIIRLSKNVLKFDLIDETAKDDEAMMAIRDAALDAKQADSDESALEDMRMRSQLAEDEEDEPGPRVSRKMLVDIGTVAGVVAAVAIVVAVALGVMRHKANAVEKERAQWYQDAKKALTEARSHLEDGPDGWDGAMLGFVDVAEKYPGTKEAEAAVEQFRRLEAVWLEHEMGQIAKSEADGNYRGALAHAGSLHQGLRDPVLKELVKERREFTERLARTSFSSRKENWEVLVEDGEVDKAVADIRRVISTIGVEDLEDEAKFFLKLIRDKGSEASPDIFTQPGPEPATPAATDPAETTKPAEPVPAEPGMPDGDIEGRFRPLGGDGAAGEKKPGEGEEDGEELPPEHEEPEDKQPPKGPPKGPPDDEFEGDIEDNFKPPVAF